jgi:hypothetical protein
MTYDNITRSCKCGKTAGKYLKDKITAVVSEISVVFGIDNGSFLNALKTVLNIMKAEPEQLPKWMEEGKRYDFFFTGWIPTKPGEVIFVKSKAHVIATDYYQKNSWTSENPSTDVNEVM